MFHKAGIKPPDDSWTMDTLLDAAKELTLWKKGAPTADQWGFTTSFGSNVSFDPLTNLSGAFKAQMQAMIANGKTTVLANPNVLAQDNAQANIKWVKRLPYSTFQYTSDGQQIPTVNASSSKFPRRWLFIGGSSVPAPGRYAAPSAARIVSKNLIPANGRTTPPRPQIRRFRLNRASAPTGR